MEEGLRVDIVLAGASRRGRAAAVVDDPMEDAVTAEPPGTMPAMISIRKRDLKMERDVMLERIGDGAGVCYGRGQGRPPQGVRGAVNPGGDQALSDTSRLYQLDE